MKIKTISKIINNQKVPIVMYNDLPTDYVFEKENSNIKYKNKIFIKKNNNVSKPYKFYLNKFMRILYSLNHCNFNNFNNNIKDIRVIEKFNIFRSFFINANYNIVDNEINLFNKDFENSFYHELLHMASTKIIDDDFILCGFSIYYKNIVFGIMLTEGCAELLNKRYFFPNSFNQKKRTVYPTQISYVKQLGKIIGIDLLEKMYFNADLRGLIRELTKYNNTESEVLEFIRNTDIIHKYQYPISIFGKYKLEKAVVKVNNFLVKSYYISLLNINIRSDEILRKLYIYIKSLECIDIGYKSNWRYMRDANDFYESIKEKKLKL